MSPVEGIESHVFIPMLEVGKDGSCCSTFFMCFCSFFGKRGGASLTQPGGDVYKGDMRQLGYWENACWARKMLFFAWLTFSLGSLGRG